ncbi:MAG: head decoration protein [Chromatiales bacterium]|nr:head decoration protein [Chromatiales bacterium]
MHTVDTYTPDALIAGNADLLVAVPITLAAGPALPRGAVLGKVTLSGHYVLSEATDTADPPVAIEDGSQVPDLILVEDVPERLTPRPALGYRRGDFQAAQITLGATHTLAAVSETLRAKGLFLI